ncbi:uncharacterized protein PGTG_19769 [Puccinia graminis f. sp. tritici CRL 75-36-700-3]|uniref:Peptidase S54 rhomboid domain-containing protein n=1 Tax=Puccinia graminis f. sp. tritici (strain CRL 75-36-700-3 / race SCCL) TaxID=418459 RepID=E3LBU7_PUCGT|nr:uncharacterized protein PGTG_19769 [Puccinia graminis f. sp. tritici CRL 75-36-700-3]EFP94022.2 hypothetical protein PGTG_19769 [Puccinia graminis f. sp. tritici CRL 75-36-700-3]
MRQSCFHSSYRWLGHLSPTKTIASSQSRMRMLKQADHVVFQIRPSNFENLRDSTRKFSSTSRMLAQLGRIDVKKMPITDHDSNFALNEDILQETRNTDSASNRKPTVWKPFAFFLGVSMLGFGLAVDQTNRDTAQKIDYIRTHQGTFPGWFSKTFTGIASYLDPSDAQLQQLRKLDKLNFIKEYGLNNLFPHHLLTWYINLALYSIGSTAHDFLTHRLRASRDVDPVRIPESTPTYHFLAFYVFAGLAASFGSHAYSLLIRAPRLLKWRQGLSKSSTPPSPILPSLGASGAIYGCLTMTALAFPEAHVSLIFLPWVPLKIGNAVFDAF